MLLTYSADNDILTMTKLSQAEFCDELEVIPMKKLLTLALAAVLALSLVACSGSIKDGTYTAYKEPSHD